MGIHCGVDIIEIDRISKSFETIGDAFMDRIFTEYEINYCESKRTAKFQSYAARFAAKEAVSKALGTGIGNGVGWKDIEVRNDERGRPYVNLSGGAKKVFEAMGGTDISLSLSHSGSNSIAFAVIQTI